MPLLKQGGSHERFSSLIHLLEPLGKVRPNIPSFPTVYSAKSAANVTLLCPAQAYPKPSYRYFPSYLVCSGKGTSINILLIFFWEPVNSVIPRLFSGDKTRNADFRLSTVVTLLCPMQAYPTPNYRYLHHFFLYCCRPRSNFRSFASALIKPLSFTGARIPLQRQSLIIMSKLLLEPEFFYYQSNNL